MNQRLHPGAGPRPAATPRRARRLLAAPCLGLVLITGCAGAVTGTARPAQAEQIAVTTAATGSPGATQDTTSIPPEPAPVETTPAEPTTAPTTGTSSTPEPTDPTTTEQVPSESEPPTTTGQSRLAGVEQVELDPADVVLKGTDDGPTDGVLRAAITEIANYWRAQSSDVFGHTLTELSGGYWSVDPDDPGSVFPERCMTEPAEVKGNAFYCGAADAMVFDRTFLGEAAEKFGELTVALVVAHEYGHALQARYDQSPTRQIARETQADCYAGAWSVKAVNGTSPRFGEASDHLDQALMFWLNLRDDVGADPEDARAHGSYFDRVSALQEGLVDGPHSCAINYSDSRVFTALQFTDDNASTDGAGNLSFDETLELGMTYLDDYWAAVLDQMSLTHQSPMLVTDPAQVPDCPGDWMIRACGQAGALLVDASALTSMHRSYGDFAMVTLMALAYADYQEQTVLDGQNATTRICTVGAFAASLYVDQDLLSPGDFDEAVIALLIIAQPQNAGVVDIGNYSIWDLLDSFRRGAFGGIEGCALAPAASG